MKIIRDEQLGGLAMIPLFFQWVVRRCNVKDCKEKPTTIITGLHPDANITGWCEKHFVQFRDTGHFSGRLVFDDFDAFSSNEKEES